MTRVDAHLTKEINVPVQVSSYVHQTPLTQTSEGSNGFHRVRVFLQISVDILL
jgi:hypothetical protein